MLHITEHAVENGEEAAGKLVLLIDGGQVVHHVIPPHPEADGVDHRAGGPGGRQLRHEPQITPCPPEEAVAALPHRGAENFPQGRHRIFPQAVKPLIQICPVSPLPGIGGAGVDPQGGVRRQVGLHQHPIPGKAVLSAVHRRQAVHAGDGPGAAQPQPVPPRFNVVEQAAHPLFGAAEYHLGLYWLHASFTLLLSPCQCPIRSTGRRSTCSARSFGMARRGCRISPSPVW